MSSCEAADLDLGVPSRDCLPARHSSETIKTLNDGPLGWSALGQKPKSWRLKVTSTLARTADIVRRDRQEGRIHLRPSLKFEGCKVCWSNPSAYFARRANHFVLSEMVCPAPFAKIFCLAPDPNHFTDSPRPVPQRAFRDRHGRWERDAVDAAALGTRRDTGQVDKACEQSNGVPGERC